MKSVCANINSSFNHLLGERVMAEQPDSRAFGAYVEKLIKDEWESLCLQWGTSPRPHPGRRTIYDVSFESGSQIIGIDIKSKDLDTTRYSDGGICSISNLLRFLVRQKGAFLLSEFGYKISRGDVSFEYVKTAPLQCLPLDIYRIENLGTGQVRLNETIEQAWNRIEWDRTEKNFLKHFSVLCLDHYRKVAGVANKRYRKIETFIDSGFTEINL